MSPGPWHVESQSDPRLACRLVQTDTGTVLASFNALHHPNALNAQVAARGPEMLAMLGRIRRTCHLTEDATLARDLDRLIGDVTGDEPRDLYGIGGGEDL